MVKHPPPSAQVSAGKQGYRVTNWPDYNRALVSRSSVTLWLHEEVLRDWRATGGKGKRYGDAAILCGLSLRAIFKLPLRQTQGFLHSLTATLGLSHPVPHYSTLSRRAHDLVVDVATGEIVAHSLTPSSRHDSPELPDLLAKVSETVAVVYALPGHASISCQATDKGYDSFDCHRAILAIGAQPVIPPKAGAAISLPPGRKDAPKTRGDAMRRIAEIGDKDWKVETGYHRRSRAETAMARYKATVGPSLSSRNLAAQDHRSRHRHKRPERLHGNRHAKGRQNDLNSGGKGEPDTA